MAPSPDEQHEHKPKTVTIFIEAKPYEVSKREMSEAELRALPEPDIASDRDLYAEGHGHHNDELIEHGEMVEMKNDLRFFSAPSTITPGRAA